MEGHVSDSENYNSLLNLVCSNIVTNVISESEQYQYRNASGNIITARLGKIEYDEDFKDETPTKPLGLTTGETGKYGITLLPGNGTSGVNSIDDNIYVITNNQLSPLGAAQSFSHEAYGHAYIYVNTKDRALSGHHLIEGGFDTNRVLTARTITAILETITNNK